MHNAECSFIKTAPSYDILCRGEHRSSAENPRIIGFSQGKYHFFALRRRILLLQNPRTTDGRPYILHSAFSILHF